LNQLVKGSVASAVVATRLSDLDRILRRQLIEQLGRLHCGRIVLEDECGTVVLGETGNVEPELIARVQVLDPLFYRCVAMNGSVGAGEAYIRGYWHCDNLVGVVRLLVRNRDLLDAMEIGLARLGGWALRVWHALRPNTRSRSRDNIAAHYDLGNEFFLLFLSPDLMYSSALWGGAHDTLSEASTRKLDRTCTQLALRPEDRVIEIGAGWGGFALHAARHYGCHVTTTTISQEQYALATERVAQAGLGGRITVLRQDYRDLAGAYDKLVSIEMIEAIGASYLDTYFAKLGSLLKPGGLALIQAITIESHRYEQALQSVDFIKRYVFPGSFIPSVDAMLAANTRSTNLALTDLHDFGPSYARTLQAWRERFLLQLAEVRRLGFDDRFIRLWEFYLAYCEGGFRERSIGVAHLLFHKPDRNT
jgi:cyclopropane-fatty-acyl-phospholipid synthase